VSAANTGCLYCNKTSGRVVQRQVPLLPLIQEVSPLHTRRKYLVQYRAPVLLAVRSAAGQLPFAYVHASVHACSFSPDSPSLFVDRELAACACKGITGACLPSHGLFHRLGVLATAEANGLEGRLAACCRWGWRASGA
jgi:hypothetical protein